MRQRACFFSANMQPLFLTRYTAHMVRWGEAMRSSHPRAALIRKRAEARSALSGGSTASSQGHLTSGSRCPKRHPVALAVTIRNYAVQRRHVPRRRQQAQAVAAIDNERAIDRLKATPPGVKKLQADDAGLM